MAQSWDQDLMSLKAVQRMAGMQNTLGPRCNVSKLSTEDGLDDMIKLRPELFRVRCEQCGHSTMYADDISIIINTTKGTTEKTAMKI